MGGFDGLRLQSIAQGMRHGFRIAEIAHESTSSSANGKIGACLADPFANGEGRSEIDTFTIPEGRRRREYRPRHKVWRKAGCSVNSKTPLPQRALPQILGQLKANRFKVVHMVRGTR